MAESAYAGDLKSLAARHVGSSPTIPTDRMKVSNSYVGLTECQSVS